MVKRVKKGNKTETKMTKVALKNENCRSGRVKKVPHVGFKTGIFQEK